MFSSKSVIWETPKWLFDLCDGICHFNTDVCALPENAKCAHYYTPEVDGLSQKWQGVCWMNPPYGKEIYHWIKKASDEAATGVKVVALLPARTDTKWFHEYIYNKKRVTVEFIKGRLKFGNCVNAAPFPSMIVIFHPSI